jgi:hypothetical protein
MIRDDSNLPGECEANPHCLLTFSAFDGLTISFGLWEQVSHAL